MLAETYFQLMRDPAHWMMELTMLLIFDIIIGMLLWPLAKKWLREHDKTHHAEECDVNR